jgi:hypothetical protein
MVPPTLGDSSWACGRGLIAELYQSFYGRSDPKVREMAFDTPVLDAPLSQWEKVLPFETLSDCEAESLRRRSASPSSVLERSAECIATDDPRLKPK